MFPSHFLLLSLSLISSCPSLSTFPSFYFSLFFTIQHTTHFLSCFLLFFFKYIFCILPLPSFKRMFSSSAPLPHLTSDDVDKALQNSPRLMHARNTGKKAHASLGNWTGALYVHHSLHTYLLALLRIRSQNAAAQKRFQPAGGTIQLWKRRSNEFYKLFFLNKVGGQRFRVFLYNRAF